MQAFLLILYRLAVNTIGLGVAAVIFRHVSISGFGTLILSAAVLTACNAFVKPLLTLLSFPFLVLTLGLFYIVISGVVVLITSFLVKGFAVDGLWAAIGVAIIVGIVNWIFDIFYFERSTIITR